MARLRLLVLPLAVALAAVALAGCGGNSVRLHSHTLALKLTEYRITPVNVHVHPGPLTIVARNDGVATHDVTVSQDTNIIGRTPILGPKETGVAHFNLPRGTYRFFSSISDQDILGMYGYIYVR